MIYNLMVLLCGFLFGCGLTISQLINPNKILNFLDISGNWDPSLLLVMLSAVTITAIGYRLVFKRVRPIFDDEFYLPKNKGINLTLILGSAIFGIGWGLSGYCPGPGITALALGYSDPVYFIFGFILSVMIINVNRLMK